MKAKNKSSHLKMIGRYFLSKTEKKKPGKEVHLLGADPEILKKGGSLSRPPWLADKGNFRFQMV